MVSPPKKVMRFDSVRPVQTSTSVNQILEEFDRYLKEPLVMENEDQAFHPIHFLNLNSHRFRFLYIMAIEILGIPASSGQLERIFSTATDIMSAKRNRLNSDLFEKISFIKRNAFVLPVSALINKKKLKNSLRHSINLN